MDVMLMFFLGTSLDTIYEAASIPLPMVAKPRLYQNAVWSNRMTRHCRNCSCVLLYSSQGRGKQAN
eukprot:16432042-Heterocapsa_arctica.AAC.1